MPTPKPAILVPDAQARALIAAIRSLGRAGYRVHAAAEHQNALGLRSAYTTRSALHPPYQSDDFIPWLRDYVHQHDIRMVVPTAGLLFAVQRHFAEFKPLLPVMDEPDRLYPCFDKTEVVRSFMSAAPAKGLMNHHPDSTVIDLSALPESPPLPDAQHGLYLKAEGRRAQGSVLNEHVPDGFAYVEDTGQAQRVLASWQPHWRSALVQQACSGVQICVSVLMANGQALAVSSVEDCHPLPHSRGTMSLRRSCRMPDIEADAIRRLKHLDWQGCAMGEYRLNKATGEFNLIEINFRFWQYLHLDLWAGMDYPRMQAEWFLEGKTDFPCAPKTGVVCRDPWPGEVAQLLNDWRRDDMGPVGKIGSTARFLARFLDPRTHYDLSFPGDRKLYWLQLADYLRLEINNLHHKVRRTTSS